MEGNGKFDFWVIYEDFWRFFEEFWRNWFIVRKNKVPTHSLPADRNDPRVGGVEPVHVESLEAPREAVQAALRLLRRVDDAALLFLDIEQDVIEVVSVSASSSNRLIDLPAALARPPRRPPSRRPGTDPAPSSTAGKSCAEK